MRSLACWHEAAALLPTKSQLQNQNRKQRGYVGEARRASQQPDDDTEELLLYTHWRLDIGYNGDQVGRG
jgi:hypothetical protein